MEPMSFKKYLEAIEDYKGKKILITGGTSGIGLEAAKILATKNANIVLLARNLSKAESTKQELLNINPNIDIDIIKYDQSDYELIDSAFKEINEKHNDFYALVANAGILYPSKDAKSKQGYPLTIETNYLGLRRFLNQIIDTCHHKRIIIQGSLAAGLFHKKKVDILSDKYSLFGQYNMSKACDEALWYKYQNEAKDNTFVLVEPGIASTDIIRGLWSPIRIAGKIFVRIFSHNPRTASLTIIEGLKSDVNNGDYFVPKHMFTMMGYPKKKRFPKKRIKEYLLKY